MGFEPQTFRPTVRSANHCATRAGVVVYYSFVVFCWLLLLLLFWEYYNGFVARHKHLLLRTQIPIPITTTTTTTTIYRIHPSGKLSCYSTSYIKAQPKIEFKYSLGLLLLLHLLLLLLLLLPYMKLGSQGTLLILRRLFWLWKWLLCSKLKTVHGMTSQELSRVVGAAHSVH